MSDFDQLAGMQPLRIWDGIAARSVHGELVSFAVIELDPGSTVPEHRHENEQLGVLASGTMRFRIGDETRELGPGATWCIPAKRAARGAGGAAGSGRRRGVRSPPRRLGRPRTAARLEAAVASDLGLHQPSSTLPNLPGWAM